MDIKLEFLMGADAIVSSLSVKAGDQVKAGDELLQYEASKGILPILAPADGIVEEVLVDQGDRIVLNDVLVRMDTDTVCKVKRQEIGARRLRNAGRKRLIYLLLELAQEDMRQPYMRRRMGLK